MNSLNLKSFGVHFRRLISNDSIYSLVIASIMLLERYYIHFKYVEVFHNKTIITLKNQFCGKTLNFKCLKVYICSVNIGVEILMKLCIPYGWFNCVHVQYNGV